MLLSILRKLFIFRYFNFNFITFLVIATLKEPVAGWIDNIYGATGVLLGVAVGLLRVLQGRSSNHADMVPADYVINSVLAAAWDVATIK